MAKSHLGEIKKKGMSNVKRGREEEAGEDNFTGKVKVCSHFSVFFTKILHLIHICGNVM